MPTQSVPIAVLPLGAHEQHGPHLPFETDTLIAQAIAHRLRDAVQDPIKIDLLPVESVGYSIEHMDVSGTRTLEFDEAINRWIGIAADCAARDVRRLLLLNAHGGNSPLLTIVATEARVRFNMLAVATSWTRFGIPEGLISPADKALDIHAGDIETSVMMAIRPDLVRLDAVRDFPSRQAEYAERFTHLRAYGPHAFGWKMSDINKEGAAGNASRASAEKGEAILAHAVHGLSELITDMAAFDVNELV
ncbi:MAG: creatininase family protein [Hoeflea sp.]|uniref:creatininase family protein n=1 Tax=Hoeflea sp. TaxID=1940281 RepID=UPI001D34F5F3|nr:creatininase family protein [Hoeflea sp.]MBU4528185.1 creatininase family protein [Alphaproteobacteria bacterium]MBU4543781.1 creatininase family protein [Alphaproteobacteria bacterium]MBU4548648.1 creatininase family protein [Alphaproteobacteria bacterium]MBV1725814.1 creatininase family protein [Hoeflea sp.]MBV1762170.1 creatininase family protein [Hoeflea sp.]